jgi:hypothetical protein
LASTRKQVIHTAAVSCLSFSRELFLPLG